ncbi:hypothetical protein T06_5712 [Trichinella sp. T6]|nr:hypothetical protein T06_5712 [Trichinella sp. T6]
MNGRARLKLYKVVVSKLTVSSWSKQTVGWSVSFKERQILAALKLFVLSQACKVWPLSSLAYKTQEQSRQPRRQN